MKFEDAFNVLLGFEGESFTKTQGDLGGETKFGISKKSYPTINIPTITQQQAMSIYGTDYWLKCKCAYLPEELQYMIFDTAVNCGQGTAVKMLQKLAGVAEDGVIGDETIKAAEKVTIEQYANARKQHYADINTAGHERNDYSQDKFINGWNNRVEKIVQMELNHEL